MEHQNLSLTNASYMLNTCKSKSGRIYWDIDTFHQSTLVSMTFNSTDSISKSGVACRIYSIYDGSTFYKRFRSSIKRL